MNDRYVEVLIERTTDVKSTDWEECHLCRRPFLLPLSVEMNQVHYDNIDNLERIQFIVGDTGKRKWEYTSRSWK